MSARPLPQASGRGARHEAALTLQIRGSGLRRRELANGPVTDEKTATAVLEAQPSRAMSILTASEAFDLVIFDCDGVLVDSEVVSLRVATQALNRAGVEIDQHEMGRRFLGVTDKAMMAAIEAQTGRPLPERFADDLVAAIMEAYQSDLAAVHGVAEVVKALDSPVCVASSSRPERIRRSLELTGLLPLFEGRIFSATQVKRGKPAPDLFLFAASSMGVEPARALVVEDSVPGVTGARAAGMRVIGFAGGSHLDAGTHGPALARAGADLVLDSYAGFADALEQLSTAPR